MRPNPRFDPVLSGGGDFPFIFDHACHLFATARLLGPGQPVVEVCALTRPAGLVTTIGDESMRRGITSIAWSYEGGAADGTWNQFEWEDAQQHPGNVSFTGLVQIARLGPGF